MFDFINVPFGYVIRFFYSLTDNYLFAILLFALVMEILLTPLAIKQQKNQIKQAKLQPKVMAIRKKYAGRNDQATQQKMQQETMEMYQRENFNPASGCVTLLIQLPIIKATTTHIPVIVGAILLGPLAGCILGGVFGICSLISNTIAPVAVSICFSPFLSQTGLVGALKATWVSVGCRILIGFVAGWLWIILKKIRLADYIALPVVGFIGSMTNTVAVLGSIFFLFRAEYAAANQTSVELVYDLIIGVVAGAGVMEAIAALVLVTAIGKALLHVFGPVQPAHRKH